MPEVGFEPTHPKITELKSAALDHSAIQAYFVIYFMIHNSGPHRISHEYKNVTFTLV